MNRKYANICNTRVQHAIQMEFHWAERLNWARVLQYLGHGKTIVFALVVQASMAILRWRLLLSCQMKKISRTENWLRYRIKGIISLTLPLSRCVCVPFNLYAEHKHDYAMTAPDENKKCKHKSYLATATSV